MKTAKTFYVMFVALFCVCSFCTGCKTANNASAWEYQDFFATSKQSLNDQVKEGWFVVNAYYDSENRAPHYLLKRLK